MHTGVAGAMGKQYMRLLFLFVAYLMTVIGEDWCPSVCTCYRRLTTTDCSGHYLTIIPLVPGTTTHLYMENNNISQLIPHAFYSSPLLHVLTMHGNKLSVLDNAVFEGLNQLEELNLSGNRITYLRITSIENATLPALKQLDLSSNQLSLIPPNLSHFSPNLQVLNLSNNRITSALVHPSYASLKHLQRIDLSANALHHIASFHLNPVRHGSLEVLRFSDCSIRFINESAFRGLSNLTSLSLANNPINTTMLAKAFHGLGHVTALAYLDLSRNTLQYITADLLKFFSKLQILDLSRAGIKDISRDAFAHLPSLQTLELQDNGLSHVSGLHKLSNLHRLNLRNNLLTAVYLNRLKNLELVDLSHNYLENIPANWISHVNGLHVLNLSHNKITKINSSAFVQVTLNHLDLTFNQLTAFHSFGDIEISMCALSHNHIRTISTYALHHLKQTLEDLDLSNNKLSYLPNSNSFGNMEAIQRLTLTYNDLGHFLRSRNNNFFYSFRHLQMLDLSFNGITAISHEHTMYLHHLTTLNLHGNKIKRLSSIPFADFSSLARLYLSENLLESVDSTLLTSLLYLEMIDLSDNPLHCTCDLWNLIQWINTTSVTVLGLEDHKLYQCTSPEGQALTYIMAYRPHKRQCLDKKDTTSQHHMVLIGILIAGIVPLVLIVCLLIYFGNICRMLKFLHYRWQIRYREVAGYEVYPEAAKL